MKTQLMILIAVGGFLTGCNSARDARVQNYCEDQLTSEHAEMVAHGVGDRDVNSNPTIHKANLDKCVNDTLARNGQ